VIRRVAVSDNGGVPVVTRDTSCCVVCFDNGGVPVVSRDTSC
jgi:hypothetical protein